MKRLVALFLLISCLTTCGDDERAPAVESEDDIDSGDTTTRKTDSRRSPDAAKADGQATKADASVSREDAAIDETALIPTVAIESPTAAADPSKDSIVVDTPVKVRCQVKKSSHAKASDINKATIKIELEVNGVSIVQKDAVEGSDRDVYEASFVRSEMKTGKISFRCSAKDAATSPHLGADEIATFFDPGPDIQVTRPKPDEAFPLIGVVPVEFTVTPVPLSANDSESAIDKVTLKLAGVNMDITEDKPNSGHYLLYPNFSIPADFPDTPNGATPLLVTATNKRTPQAAVATANYSFILDGQGPTIKIDQPANGQIVGGDVTLKFTVKDSDSTVNPASVFVRVNGLSHYFDAPGEQWSRDKEVFTYRFDTRNVVDANGEHPKVELTIDVDAEDTVKNKAAGASLVLRLDNQPPYISLDPPNVRERKKIGLAYYCSQSFDPVGDEATNDLEKIPTMAMFRALVWDQTNTAPGQTIFYFSNINRDKVYLYVQDDVTQPFLVDNDKDKNSECDDLAWEKLPYIMMTPLLPVGSSNYNGPKSDFAKFPQVPNYDPDAGTTNFCSIETGLPPPALCPLHTSDMTRIISHGLGSQEPVIYAVSVDANNEACTGNRWEKPFIQEGWLCVAVRAEDNAGNIGFSLPLRVCLDDQDGTNGTPDCDTLPDDANCRGKATKDTKGCNIPAGFGTETLGILEVQ